MYSIENKQALNIYSWYVKFIYTCHVKKANTPLQDWDFAHGP